MVQQLTQLRDRFETSLLCLAKVMVKKKEVVAVLVTSTQPGLESLCDIDLEGKWRFVREVVVDYHNMVEKQHPVEPKITIMDESYTDHPEQVVVVPCAVGVCQSRSLKESIRQLDEAVESVYEELIKLEECINQQQQMAQQSRMWSLFSSSALAELKNQESLMCSRMLRLNGMLDDRLKRFSDAMTFCRLVRYR